MMCELAGKCNFYNDELVKMPTTAVVIKKLYCTGNSGNCVRKIITDRFGAEKVPLDLMPDNRKYLKTFTQY